MHGTEVPKGADERLYEVTELTRVEGEGSLRLRVRDGKVVEASLGIFETPRYFEQIVVGRTPDEVIDIVARICGICPIAYQMSAVHAFEDLFGVAIDPAVRALRRLLYCGEWIESHALHIYLLHAPDFLGYESAIAMAADHRETVEKALRMKKAGNHLIGILGGRSVHPVSVRVGGFSRVPRRRELEAHRPALAESLELAKETVRLTASLPMPAFAREPRVVSLRHPDEYPYNDGRIVSSDGLDLRPSDWGEAFEESHVERSNALHARAKDGKGVYLVGPAARVVLAADQLHPVARELLAETGMAELIRTNIYASIVARAVELVHALAEAIDIIDAYRPPAEPMVAWTSRPGVGAWATEAPRGLLFHRYEVDERGRVAAAQIVPPTSQNQAAIERDLVVAAPNVIDLPQAEATVRLEQMIRSYDPCISCATHFLDLRIEEED
ncbi:MAG: Ni/Fe hydrogenase subunit alpha [Chloroflexi bacterium]|jgi:coenzyme F420-reducing hydrogenase alpha subunit|nr:Ni/Fe hydrogenase subunit alpha [Chloroflexota bacterium]